MFDINLYKKHLLYSNFGEIEYFSELDSTNSKALELSELNTTNGTVIVTDNQTAGRGRRDNKWSSTIGKSLTFSIIIYPNCSIDQISQYSIITGLAVSDTLSDIGLSPKLKWPNDILIKGKKICGILIKSKLSSKSIKSLVIGIGLNVNEELTDFSTDLRKISTSVNIEMNHEQVREQILASIVNNLNRLLNIIDDFGPQIEEWEQRCAHMNREVSFHNNNDTIVGVFKGLTETGLAKIIINDKERIFNSGELETL